MKPVRRALVLAALAGIATLSFALRVIELPRVVSPSGEVIWGDSDANYHARRALYSFVNFPKVLRFDPYLAHPKGAEVPLPPLFDWTVGGVARMFGDDEATFERVAIWVSPVLGVLATLFVFGAGRALRGSACGIVAAATFAVLPLPAFYARVGNVDHHAAVAAIGALWLWLWLESVSSDQTHRRGLALALGRGVVIAVMLLTWSGSLLFVAIAEGAGILAAGVVGGRRDLLISQGISAALAMVLVLPVCLTAGVPIGGALTSTTLSWLHPLALGCLAVLCAALVAGERRWPARGVWQRALRASALALTIAVLVLALLPVGAGLAPGAGFVSGVEAWAEKNPEQRPLYRFLAPERGAPPRPPFYYYGVVTYLLPLVPLAFLPLLRDPRRRLAAVVLLVWTSSFGVLALTQIRFGNELGAPLCVTLAWMVLAATDRFAPRWPLAGRALMGAGLVAALIGPGACAYHDVRVAARKGPPTNAQEMARFFGEVRRLTPETSGFVDDGRPEYGLLVPAPLGHLAVYEARRPTPAGNLGAYLDARKFRSVLRFYAAPTEAHALAIADRLDARFVVAPSRSSWHGRVGGDLAQRGAAHSDRAHLGRFRFMAESAGLKLFEIVPGAVIEAHAEPGMQLVAELQVPLGGGRDFRFRAWEVAGPDGAVRIRVPYATGPDAAADAAEPYTVTIDGRSFRVAVDARDVSLGRTVKVGAAAPDPQR